jgi:hypothetical protein
VSVEAGGDRGGEDVPEIEGVCRRPPNRFAGDVRERTALPRLRSGRQFCKGSRSGVVEAVASGERLEILIYFGVGRRHTFVTSSATAIPSDTSTKR